MYNDTQDISFILNHLGEDRLAFEGSVAPPLYQTSTFCYPTVEDLRHAIADERHHCTYTRGLNPTVRLLCQKLAALDRAEAAFVFASGSAAISAALLGNLKQGDHVVCVQKPYSWTYKLLTQVLNRFGVQTTFVDATDVAFIEAAMRPDTRVIYLESPNSFTFELQDVPAVATLAKERGVLTILDNSFAGLMNPSPLDWGVDILVYSATKYHAGHSDVVAGALSCSEQMAQHLFYDQYMMLGAVPSPFTAWLMLRSLRTLPLRMERVNRTTRLVVEFLEASPLIERVYYPLSPSHPQYELASRQLLNGNGLVTIQLKTNDIQKIDRFCNALRRFLLAVSWGGYESLALPVRAFYVSDLPVNLVRLSIGFEEPDVLIADLAQALEYIR
jgi:cystathionine beta-lyase/cystathionine gamma-synthase